MWHHAGKQQHFVWHPFAHITAEHLWPCSPRGWHTALHAQGPQFWTCLPLQVNRKRRELCCLPRQFWCQSSLQIHRPCQILSLYLKTFITYCPLPPQTCASFSSFPPCTLCLSHPSFPLASYFLTFLSHRVSWNRTNNLFLVMCHMESNSLSRDLETALPALESLNRKKF